MSGSEKNIRTHFTSIKKLRKNNKFTGVQVANKLNISSQYYYEIERGEKRLSAENAVELAIIFGVSLDYLLTGVDNSDVNATNLQLEKIRELELFHDTTKQVVGEKIYHLILDEIDKKKRPAVT